MFKVSFKVIKVQWDA